MNNFPCSLIFVGHACKYVQVCVHAPTHVHASVCVHACKGYHFKLLSTLFWGAEFDIDSLSKSVSTRATSGTGDLAEPLGALAALAEDMSLTSSIYIRGLITAYN